MAIALDHLRGDRRGLETELLADIGFDRGRQVCERADRARQLTHRDDRTCAANALSIASDLGVPQRQLQTQCHRLCVNAVRATDHRRHSMFEGSLANRFGESIEIPQDDVARLAHLQGLRRVDDVGRGHAEVHPPGRLADFLGNGRRERNHVVLRDLLYFFDASDVECAALANVAGGLGRDDAGSRHGFGSRRFHEQPRLVSTLVAPDSTHFRVCVALDQSGFLPLRTRITPRDTRPARSRARTGRRPT